LDGKKEKIKRYVKNVLTFAILGYHGAVKAPTGNLDRPFAQERFDKTRRVAVAFGSMAQPSKFSLIKSGGLKIIALHSDELRKFHLYFTHLAPGINLQHHSVFGVKS